MPLLRYETTLDNLMYFSDYSLIQNSVLSEFTYSHDYCYLLQVMQQKFKLNSCICKKCWIICVVCISNSFRGISSASWLFFLLQIRFLLIDLLTFVRDLVVEWKSKYLETDHSISSTCTQWFSLVSLFNGISIFMGYLMPKLSL